MKKPEDNFDKGVKIGISFAIKNFLKHMIPILRPEIYQSIEDEAYSYICKLYLEKKNENKMKFLYKTRSDYSMERD